MNKRGGPPRGFYNHSTDDGDDDGYNMIEMSEKFEFFIRSSLWLKSLQNVERVKEQPTVMKIMRALNIFRV